MNNNENEYIIIDFETTGLSSAFSRIIEVGAVKIKDNQIISDFQTLLNPGTYIPKFISNYTGITNEMVQDKPSPEQVMPELYEFIGDKPLIAHNASFDRKFLCSEMRRAHLEIKNPFLCTLLLSRRLIHNCYNYKLQTLADHLSINRETLQSHRALDDVIMTAHIWFHMYDKIRKITGREYLDLAFLETLMTTPKRLVHELLCKKTC